MAESLAGMKRSHYCGEVMENLIGQTVTVMGWVNKQRDLPTVIFIVLRDRTGIVQIAVSKDSEHYALAKSIRGEFVVAATGKVIARTPENVNKDMPTGAIEIDVNEIRVLSEAEVPPFQVADEGVAMDTRLKYRYMDLRRPEMQQIFTLRHNAAQSLRKYLSGAGFLEIETPVLINSSPEGARDYLVPSRMHTGSFYALPQSPQQMKQILMVSGFDKYFQLARCFRDEDLRADRQPEFTQVDIEMSFAEEDDIMKMTEEMMGTMFKEVLGVELPEKFPRFSWKESMERFGTDKPDTRYGMELCDISETVRGVDFQVFANALENGGSVRGINAEGCATLPRKQIDALVEVAKTHKAKGLAWITLPEDGTIKSTISKFFTDEQLRKIAAKFNAKAGDLILICADENRIVCEALGAVRVAVANKRGLTLEGFNFLWVTEFPLLEWSPDDGRFFASTHPFTSPVEEDMPLLETDPAAVRSRSYDLVLNGFELGSGSVRIHRQDMQDKMFNFLGFTKDSAAESFGYFLEALKYGVPPHCGIGLGFDRIIMIMTGADSLREVIAFPKVKDASCPLTNAPNEATAAHLAELGIEIANADG
ncbi:MAG: aspartate--tRNA ligase [Defluviitaleaceae bacterium]|nr:aspartate--tRNA ligase [Defluviitaleaceae bacterium]MCL2261594.1 aspartate--tRNA ligase [Defluviitaleaceae bacterium]